MYKIKMGTPYPLGAYVENDNIHISFVCEADENVGINLYLKSTGKKSHVIELNCEYRIGNIYCVVISGINSSCYDYTFFCGEEEFCDPYGKLIAGNERFGVKPGLIKASFVEQNTDVDITNISPLKTDYCDSVMYLLHVRGFTKHRSSGVNAPGTFEGIIMKIPYLKELGVTALELMPAYEFIELENGPVNENTEAAQYMEPYSSHEPKLNYWGYKDAFYFAPKAAYAAKGMKATDSFKNMVSALHNANIEVIMQFYFKKDVKPSFVLEVLKYWVMTYKVDGFHLLGENIPLTLIATEPLLANTKLMYYDFPIQEIYNGKAPKYKNLAVYNDEYMYSFRRFLKSDEGQIHSVTYGMTAIDEKAGKITYLTNCNGFTLYDLVSYDRKHNELNGENNRDGNPYNASWNCGKEGSTSKRSVIKLRKQQIRNAITLNLLSQSTPLILAGDEFLNSQKGNNNPYCIDGPLTWLNWNDIEKNKSIYDFYKKMIEFRKENKILHMPQALKMNDYLATGIPDMSFHGDEAWRFEPDDLTRHFAILYNMAYADADKIASGQDLMFIAVNMHWTEHEFALPDILEGQVWNCVIDTYNENGFVDEILVDTKKIIVKERSIIVLRTK